MRTCLVLYGDIGTVSGGFLYDRMILAHLARRGDETKVLSLPWKGYPQCLAHNISGQLLRRILALSPDVIIEDELAHPSLFLANRRLRKQLRVPLVALVHHLRSSETRPPWMNRCYGFVEDRFLSSVDAFIFNSADTAKRVLARPGTDKPFVIARPGRDHRRATVTQSDIRRRAAGPGPVTILFVGNVIPRKGLHVLLRALAPLAGHDWRLLVAGSLDDAPAYVRAIARQLSRSGLTSRVTLLGRVSDRALTGLLRDSHLLAVPSFHEGYGIVYIEAMGSGLPVIAGSQGGAREIVDHGYNGFLVEPGDADVLTGHIARLIDDRKTLLAMGFAAFKSHADQPTWEDTGESVHRFLHSLRAG